MNLDALRVDIDLDSLGASDDEEDSPKEMRCAVLLTQTAEDKKTPETASALLVVQDIRADSGFKLCKSGTGSVVKPDDCFKSILWEDSGHVTFED